VITTASSGAGAALRVEAIAKRFDDVDALAGIDLELGPHELVALVGPSGCGKSTFLRAIAGLEPVDHGRIELGGIPVDDGRRHLPPEHRRIGLVFQEHSLFPHLRVAANVAFGIRDAGCRETARRVDEVLELVALPGHRDRYPHELSGGERQRVALARALAPRPRLMLLDEPFASLDPNLRVQLRADVVDALRATGTPAVFVTHEQTEALAVGDRIAVMRAGRIEHLADPDTIFHRPANRFVGAFMGEATFLPILRDATGARTALGPLVTDADVAPGALAMVRPDDVTFHAGAGDADVVGAEFRGTTWCYTIRLADGTTLLSTRSHLEPLPIGTTGNVELTPGHRQIALPGDP
jgi:iron(III) transport system ATP-binding protein